MHLPMGYSIKTCFAKALLGRLPLHTNDIDDIHLSQLTI